MEPTQQVAAQLPEAPLVKPRNKGGRPTKAMVAERLRIAEEARAAREAARSPRKAAVLQQPVQTAVQETPSGRVQAAGRDGEILTRKRPTNVDQFHIPPEIVPSGWDYQWNVVSVTGQEFVDIQIAMAENGWRPVPAGRHPGRFMPSGTPANAAIVRGGLRLEERPMILSQEAKMEEARKAGLQVSDQLENLGLTQKMPSGFSRDNPNLRRMERQGTSRSYGPAPDISRPVLPIEN